MASVKNWNRIELSFSVQGMRFQPALDQTGKQVSLLTAAIVWSQAIELARLMGWSPADRVSFRFSRPLHLSLKTGTRSSAGVWTFNPLFTDWMMGWPEGWTEPMQQAMGWSRWLQRMRGALSALPSIGPDGWCS